MAAPQSLPARDLTNQLVETNAGLARSIASRYRNRGIDLDDLEQVAMLLEGSPVTYLSSRS